MGEIICGLLVVFGNVDACFISDDLELFLDLTTCGLFAFFFFFGFSCSGSFDFVDISLFVKVCRVI